MVALRAELAFLCAELTDVQMAVADLRRLIRNVGLVKPIEEDYAYRTLADPQIAAVYCWERGQGPDFVTLVDAPDQAALYAVYELQAELGAVHLGEPYVSDQTPPRQPLATARLAITDLLGDGAACIFQRPE
jgi:hypothetical protein